MEPVGRMNGDSLPVSAFVDYADGTVPAGRRCLREARRCRHRSRAGTAETTASQCNQCAYVCPHATIRPYALNAEEAADGSRRHQDGRSQGCPRASTSTPWPSARSTAWAAASASSVCPMQGPGDGRPRRASSASRRSSTTWSRTSPSRPTSPAPTTSRQGQPVPASRLLEFSGSCAGCAETALRPPRHPALRRPDVHLQRHRLLLHLGRSGCHSLRTRINKNGKGRCLGQLPV